LAAATRLEPNLMVESPEKPDWPDDKEIVEEPAAEELAAAEPESLETALVPQDALQRYLAEIRRYPLLTPEEEHRLAVQYREYGDIQAAYRLVTANLRLVVMIARRYERAFRNLFDLVQEGNIGLMEAVKKFDPYRGIRFPSYAVWWIRAYIVRYIMNNFRLVKLGTTQAQRRLFFNLQKEKQRLEAEGFDTTPKLIAERLDVRPEEVVEMDQRMGARDLSVDTPVGDGEETSMLSFLSSDGASTEDRVADAHYQKKLAEKMQEFGATLAGKDRTIFEKRLLTEEPQTLQEIGEMYHVSRERVRQIEERLKKRLREFLLREMKDLQEIEVVAPVRRRKRRKPAEERPPSRPAADS
jgi:RNA polymerase sigma-32 factor